VIKSLDEEYSHLKEPIELCKRLFKRRFGLTALQLINITVRRHREPTEVMKAIEAYGALREIRKETDQTKTVLAEIKGKVVVSGSLGVKSKYVFCSYCCDKSIGYLT